MRRTSLIHLQFYLELPFDVGLSGGAFNTIEMAHRPLEAWEDFDLQGFLGMPPLPEPAVRPCVLVRFQRVTNAVDSPLANVQRAYGSELESGFPAEAELQAPTKSVTVVKAERIVPGPGGEFDENWIRGQFRVVLSKLNGDLLALGAATGDHRIGPVHELELQPVIPGWEQDLRDLGDPAKTPRAFWLLLHAGRYSGATDHDATVINHALGLAARGGGGPFFSTMEFLFAARRSLEMGRLTHAVLETGTAVELLVSGVVRAVGLRKQWTAQKLENVLGDTMGFRNRFVDHFARALGVVVDQAASGADPVNNWLRVAYPLRNKIVHSGYQPTNEEAVQALVLASALMDYVADTAENDAQLGITFPNLSDLIPSPGLDERSIAQERPPSEARLAQAAFDEALGALERDDLETAADAFEQAHRHGSSRGAFNLGIIKWRADDLDAAIVWLRRAADLDHAGACAYLGVLLLERERLQEAEELFRRVSPGAHRRGWPLAAFFLAAILADRDELEEAALLYRDAAVVADFSLAAEAAFRRGLLLQELGDAAAIDAFQLAVELGSASAAVALADYFTSDGRVDEASEMLRRAVELDAGPTADSAAIGHGLELRFSDIGPLALQQGIARALGMNGAALDEQDRGDEAVAVYDELVARFEDSTAPALREAVARALLSKSASLGRRGYAQEAVLVCDQILARFESAPEPGLREQLATALANKASALIELGRREEAVVVYDELVARFADLAEPAFGAHVAIALGKKSALLAELERWEETVAASDEILARFADATESLLRGGLGWALLRKGAALGELDRQEEALTVYDDIVVRFADATEPSVRALIATALVSKAIVLGELGRFAEAIAVNDDIVARFAQAIEPTLREQVARALANKGVMLARLARPEEAVAVYDDVVTRFADAGVHVARALVNKAAALSELGRSEEAVAVYDDVLTRYADATEPKLREAVANALLNKGEMLREMGRRDEAVAAYDELIVRLADATEPVIRDRIATARQQRADL
jgi:tetratricopeptide (TPR) repeat protein